MRSVAKGNYIKGVGGIRHALAHVRYLQMRGGDDRDHALGGKRLFINANREAISGSEVNERIKDMDESKVVIHRIVLSPGVEGVDMNAYTRAVMTELERSKGLDIEYYATGHKNTDHDHNHVIVLGRDQHGRQVTLNRSNYKTIREAGDRYLERHHKYDRYLDKELDTIIRDGYKHDKGDRHFEWLLEDLKSNLTIEECDEQRRNTTSGFDKEFAIYALPESERIVRDNVVYTKYSSLHDLLELNEKLTKGQVQRVPNEQYQKMWSWIGNKKQFGDDYYEKTAEADRIFQQFEEDLKRSLSTDNSPPKSFRQYIFESRGRLLDSHEKYTIDTQRLQLEKHLQALDASGKADPVHRQGLIEQLEWLAAMLQERIESRKPIPKISRSKENEKPMHENIDKERNLFDSKERERWSSELVERAWKKLLGDQPDDYNKFSPQGKKATQEALGREIAKITAEDHLKQKQEPMYWSVENRPEHAQKISDNLAATYETELSQRAWNNVSKDRIFDLNELTPEIREQETNLWRQEIEIVRAEDRTFLSPEDENLYWETDLDHKAEEYEISVHNRAYVRVFDDRHWDFDKLSPEFKAGAIEDWQQEVARLRSLDERSPRENMELPPHENIELPQSNNNENATMDLTIVSYRNSLGDLVHQYQPTIKNNSQETEEKVRSLEEPLDSAERHLDVDKNQSHSNISRLIFGDEPSITISDHDKLQIDHQIDLWQKIAFDGNQNRLSPDHNNPANPFGDIEKMQNNSIEQSQQTPPSMDQIMSRQMQEHLHQQIRHTFQERPSSHIRADHTPLNKENHIPGQERDEDGKEHNR